MNYRADRRWNPVFLWAAGLRVPTYSILPAVNYSTSTSVRGYKRGLVAIGDGSVPIIYSGYTSAFNSSNGSGTGDFSLVFSGETISEATTRALFTVTGDSAYGIGIWGNLNETEGATSGAVAVRVKDAGGYEIASSDAAGLWPLGKPLNIVATRKNGTLSLFYEGRLIRSVSSSKSIIPSATGRVAVGASWNTGILDWQGGSTNIRATLAAALNRGLTNSEARDLSLDPWLLLERGAPKIFSYGTAPTSTYPWTASGGAVSSGAAVLAKIKNFTVSGGAVAAGVATTARIVVRSFTASGGATASGVAVLAKIKNFPVSGGAVAGGVASTAFVPPGATNYPYTASGGAVAGGESTYAKWKNFIAAGGSVAGGAATTAYVPPSSTTYPWTGSGGAVAGGAATLAKWKKFTVSGGAVASGAASTLLLPAGAISILNPYIVVYMWKRTA